MYEFMRRDILKNIIIYDKDKFYESDSIENRVLVSLTG